MQNNDLKETWSNIVSKVEHANLDKLHEQKQKQKERKQKYKKELFSQMDQCFNNYEKQTMNKRFEKQIIEKMVQDEVERKNYMRKKVRKKEQFYQQDNLKLINQKLEKIEQDKKKNRYGQNPFVKLVDRNDQRQYRKKLNLKKQLEINQEQFQLKQKNRKEEAMKNRSEKQVYENFVQNSFQNKEKQRQNFKLKYLKLKPYEKQKLKTQPNSIEKEYIEYLNHQAHQNLQKKHHQGQVDSRLSKFNFHLENPNSSPAYLGKSPQSYDREKQMNYIDKQLGLSNKSYSRVASVPLEPIAKDQRLSIRQMDQQLNSYYKKNSNNKKIDSKKGTKQKWFNPPPKQIKQLKFHNNSLNNEEKYIEQTSARYSKPQTPYNPITKTQRVYKHYNIISGQDKHYKLDFSYK